MVKGLNQFPAKDGVSDTLSPLTILTGIGAPDYQSLRLEFGSYAMVFEDNDPSNTTKARTTGAIALTHTGNRQGDYHFMSLITGRRLARHQWTALPMPNQAILAVEERAQREGQPLIAGGCPNIAGGCPRFEWRQEPVEENDADDEVSVVEEDEEDHEEDQHGFVNDNGGGWQHDDASDVEANDEVEDDGSEPGHNGAAGEDDVSMPKNNAALSDDEEVEQ